jgi:hypothetical protein
VKLYDEKVWVDVKIPGGIDQVSLRVRLFRLDAEDSRVFGVDKWSVYLRVEEIDIYGPGDEQPRHYQKIRTYTSGPDHKRIREAIAAIDGFKESGT